MRTALAWPFAALAFALWFASANAAAIQPYTDAVSPVVARPAVPDPTDDDASAVFERSDCAVKDAVCHAGCAAERDVAGCIGGRCEARLRQCQAALPTGRTPPLPAACSEPDQ